jgi:hypothetical protein
VLGHARLADVVAASPLPDGPDIPAANELLIGLQEVFCSPSRERSAPAMRLINRTAVIIQPKQPCVDWINTSVPANDAPMSLPDLRQDCTALLIREFDSDAARSRYLAKLKPTLFVMELASWNRDPNTWPEDRSARAFNAWFDLEIHSIVWDTVDGPITHEPERSIEEEFQLLP